MSGSLSVLNAGIGDIKITFDKNNQGDKVRARRIIKDMLSRGYALFVEVDDAYTRAIAFDEEKDEYIIADFDPTEGTEEKAPRKAEAKTDHKGTPKRRGRKPKKRLKVTEAKAVGVARSAGG